MRLQPRHYILLLLVLALGTFNFVRSRRHAPATPATVTHRAEPSGPRPESSAWTAFDHAASLRDTSAEQFAPALTALHQQRSQVTIADSDLSGCSTWLEFYRQGVLHPSRDPSWRNRSTEHLDGCVKYHRDVSF